MRPVSVEPDSEDCTSFTHAAPGLNHRLPPDAVLLRRIDLVRDFFHRVVARAICDDPATARW